MEDCIFCKIISGNIPSKKVYENEDVLAFNDVSPQAPVHIIIIPKEHIHSLEKLMKAITIPRVSLYLLLLKSHLRKNWMVTD